MAIKIRLDKAGLRTDANKVARTIVNRTTRKILNRSAVLCKVDSGRLRASGRMKVYEGARGPAGIVEYPVDYAAAVHDGTRPHVIRAKRKKTLAFMFEGRMVFAKSVRHPGTNPSPFLAQAAKETATAEGLRFIPRNN